MNDPFIKAVEILTQQVKVLRSEIEGWRTHTGSTGDFLLVAIENLQKELARMTKLIKEKP